MCRSGHGRGRGCAYSLTLTPVGRVLRRSAHGEDRPALFAAHFALSHACWLVAYPVAGFASASFGADRDFGQKRFGDHGYALEEVVADLCAAMLGAELQIPDAHIDDHASYLASWLRVLDEQPSAFLTAAGKAQQAADYLMGLMGLSVPPDPG